MAATVTHADGPIRRREYKAKSGVATELSPLRLVESSASTTDTPLQTETNVTANWHRYLDGLVARALVRQVHIAEVRALWRNLSAKFTLSAPSTIMTSDGALQLTWDLSQHHVEIDVFENGDIEWLYVDRTTGKFEGSEDRQQGIPDALGQALAHVS